MANNKTHSQSEKRQIHLIPREHCEIAERLNRYRDKLERYRSNMEDSNRIPQPTMTRAWIQTNPAEETRNG